MSEAATKACDDLGLTIDAKFVPWSQSRNKGEKDKSLNWLVSLSKDGKTIVTTDYMAGVGHAPSYKAPLTVKRNQAVDYECEHGHTPNVKQAIMPKREDVIHSLVSDSDAIDYATYEDWADSLGYDQDSRKGEAIYRACLATALKLRNALGEAALAQLREAFQDY